MDQDRLDVHGGDELARLAQTFNRTLDVLDSSVQAQRNLVADASHELRTPIATIRANLQLMRDEELLSPEDREALRADVIEELDELTALVGDVVELARGSKPSSEPGDIRVDEIVANAIERTRRRAPQLTVVSSLEPTLVRGEGDRIARAVANLLDNAAKWSPPGTAIEVGLRDGTLTVCRSYLTASTGLVTPARSRGRGSGWPSCVKPPRPTTASSKPPMPRTAARSCGSASVPSSTYRSYQRRTYSARLRPSAPSRARQQRLQ